MKTDEDHRNTVLQRARSERSWYDVVRECERICGCPDTAENPTMSNLPNLVRGLKNGIGCPECAKLREYIRDHVHAFIDSDEIDRLLSYDEWREKRTGCQD